MAKEQRIRDFLPEKDDVERVLVQARVPTPLRDRTKALMDAEGITWEELFVASFEKFLAETKKK